MPSPPVLTVEHWRIRDDVEEIYDPAGSPTWVTTEDQATALSWDLDVFFRLRLCIENASGNKVQNNDFDLQFRINSGTWTGAAVEGTTVEGCTYASPTVNGNDIISGGTDPYDGIFFLTAAAGTEQQGRYNETELDTYQSPDGANYTENEFALILPSGNTNSAEAGDTVEFRFYFVDESVAPTNNATVPTITISGGSSVSIPVMYYHHKHHNLAG